MKLEKYCLLGLLFIVGCAVTPEQYVKAHPELSEKTKDHILNEQVTFGMSHEEVEASWGKPHKINKNEKQIQWVYFSYTTTQKILGSLTWLPLAGSPEPIRITFEDGVVIKYDSNEFPR